MTPEELRRAHVLNQMYPDTDRPEPKKSFDDSWRICSCGERYNAFVTRNYMKCPGCCARLQRSNDEE